MVETLSPSDRPSDIIALEADYRTVSVRKIWLIDLPRKMVKALRKKRKGYEEEVLTEDVFGFRGHKRFWAAG